MIYPKVVAMKCDTDFIPGRDRDVGDVLLWTANIRHGLFSRRTVTARSINGITWNVIGTDRHSGPPGMTVWCMLVERCAAMKDSGSVSWTASRA